ncbi:MAG: PqqD family protein [Coriobacteriia bacterium]|nr:PqqD family protein [Coriobacteriia bacterium]
MKLKSNFLTHIVDGEQVLVDVENKDFSGIVRNNQTAAFVVDCLSKETDINEIVDAMYNTFDAPKDVIKRDVEGVIDQLNSIGALE